MLGKYEIKRKTEAQKYTRRIKGTKMLNNIKDRPQTTDNINIKSLFII